MKRFRDSLGFTLLELLAVMAIMVILMSISGAAYYGMSRGAALRGAASNVRSTLSLARQFAATRRSSTYVLLWQDDMNAYYRTFVVAGVDAGVLGGDVLDVHGRGLSGTDSSLEGGEIYKLSTLGSSGYEMGTVTYNAWDPEIRMSKLQATKSGGGMITWNAGDVAGWAIRSEGRLPAGVRYKENRNEVVFKPDGSVGKGAGDIVLEEARGEGTRTITVEITGLIVEK